MTTILIYLLIGLLSGAVMGFFGLAGGIIVVPGLMYLAGFSQKVASGTNLLILMLPLSFAAALEYYRAGNTNIKAALIIAPALCLAAWLSSRIASRINGEYLRLAYGLFVIAMGIYICIPVAGKLLRH